MSKLTSKTFHTPYLQHKGMEQHQQQRQSTDPRGRQVQRSTIQIPICQPVNPSRQHASADRLLPAVTDASQSKHTTTRARRLCNRLNPIGPSHPPRAHPASPARLTDTKNKNTTSLILRIVAVSKRSGCLARDQNTSRRRRPLGFYQQPHACRGDGGEKKLDVDAIDTGRASAIPHHRRQADTDQMQLTGQVPKS